MQTTDSQQIILRFYKALKFLKSRKKIRGINTFTNRYNINRWNMITQMKSPERDMFQVAWLTYLVNDYGISAEWLLTGEGSPMSDDIMMQ